MGGCIISELDPHKAPYPSSFWSYCFPRGSLVSTPDGTAPVEEIDSGEKVYDAEGKVTTVEETAERSFTGHMVTLSLTGTTDLQCTAEHPVMAYPESAMTPKWVEAKDVEAGDRLVSPSLKQRQPATLSFPDASPRAVGAQPLLGEVQEIDPTLAHLMGEYLGDGCATVTQVGKYDRGRCSITYGKHDRDKAERTARQVGDYFGGGAVIDTDTAVRVDFGATTVAKEMIRRFGKHAHTKHVPTCILHSDSENIIRQFLQGYFDRDGHQVSRGKSKDTLIASSASASVIYGVQLLLARLGVWGSVHVQKRTSSTTEIRGREVNQRKKRYRINVPASKAHVVFPQIEHEGNRSARKVERRREDFLLTVNSVEQEYVEAVSVYNFRTESGTYMVQNLAVHNCGLDVVDGEGRSRKEEHLETVEYVNSDGETDTRKSLGYNPFIKTKLMGVLGPSFLKAGSAYRDHYDRYRHRKETDPDWADASDGHLHQASLRYMVKQFLISLHMKWRDLEGLPVSRPYHAEKQGQDRHVSEREKQLGIENPKRFDE
jgi:hypothetical protein